MEVVLSPGRFGDEVPGAPFQNEEIREWSHVDRLTGMLERARVETGRWKTLNQEGARSYGKVIDSRERNSADGSVVQRARRQVEVFQSQGPGRSVQVVRASQWSSSRITDSSSTTPLALTSLAQKQNGAAITETLVPSSRLNNKLLSPPSSLSRDESISERLSSLLGSFAHHTSSSTVPLRRIDSKYATRTPISLPITKRSTSNEDLSNHNEIHSGGLLAATTSLRESQRRSCQEIQNRSKVPQQIEESAVNLEKDRHEVHEISVEREESKDYTKILSDDEDFGASDNSQSVIAIDELRPTTSKAAIQLLPSSKANTTVVNLINDSASSQTETTDIREGKRANILSWVLPSSVVGEEAARTDAEEATTTTTTTPSTATATTTTSPRRESRIEEPAMLSYPGRSVKRVGFCKTEIHFAADSGKVNIVETDGKPPPTNKFRRRRRNSLTGVSSGKNLPIEKLPLVEAKDSLDPRTIEECKTRSDPNLQRGHTTTVNLGSDPSTKNERPNRGFPEGRQRSSAERHQEGNFPGTLEASSQGILLRLENRIYDRLESYSSELFLDSAVSTIPKVSSTINIQQSALKSARLVMNLTRGCVSKILIDKDVSRTWSTKLDFPDDDETTSNQLLPIEPHVDSEKEAQEDSANYLDWEADNEVQCIMLGSTSLKNRSANNTQALKLFAESPTANEPQSIHENSDTPRIENVAPSEAIGETIEEDNDSSLHSALISVESEPCNVVCTDADNNQVLLKVVTTHEPTIARVESDHLRKKIRASAKIPASAKKERRSHKDLSLTARKSDSHKEHTYVNVFTGSQRAPIYENYKVIVDPSPIADNKNVAPLTTDAISVTEKSVHVADTKAQVSQSSSSTVSKSREIDSTNLERVKIPTAAPAADDKLSNATELRGHVEDRSQAGSKKVRSKSRDSKSLRTEGSSGNTTSQPAASSRGRSGKHPTKNPTPRSSVSSSERSGRLAGGSNTVSGNNSGASKSARVAISAKTINKGDAPTKQKPIEVVYQTAVYNMKNEKLKKPAKGKESKGPRYLNELICGAKMKRPSDSKNGKSSSTAQNGANNKSALQPIKHWK